MGSFWVENAPKPAPPTTQPSAPTNTGVTGGNLGGYQPEIFAQDKVMYPNGHPNTGIDPNPITWNNDPRVTTQPQPYQQLPTGDGVTGAFGGGISRPPGGSLGQMPGPYSPDMGSWIQSQMAAHRRDPNQGSAPERMNADVQRYLQEHGRWQGGSLGQMGGPIQQQMQQNGGFYAPPAISRPPDQQSQQPGQVGMRSPDGQHFQYVNAEHVPHYQSRGATVYNGSSYGGGNGV